MAFTDQTARVVDELRAEAARMTDARARRLVEAWVRAWDLLSADFQAAIVDLLAITPGEWPTRAQVLRAERTLAALAQARDRLDVLADTARVGITTDATTAATAGADGQLRAIAAQLPQSGVQVALDRLPREALDAIVARSIDQITALTRPLSTDATDAMKTALIRGIAIGDNPRATAAYMLRRVQGAFNGGLTRALTIARTETLDAYRAGAAAQQQANANVLTGWRWLADLSPRTCPACLALNGTVHALEEAGPAGHPNCRCARVPVTKSWTDLGFTVDEPADAFPDARAWFDAQPADIQLRIMGPARLAALRAGTPWEQLAVLRHNSGWRDSWQTRPARDLQPA